MGMPKISRRWFLRTAVYSFPVACAADAFWLEPQWVTVRTVGMSSEPAARIAHFTDLHHRGDRAYLTKVVNLINDLSPDFACFTGDIVERKPYLLEALDCLSGLRVPAYGVRGNWDYVAMEMIGEVSACFEATGGAWLLNDVAEHGDIHLRGVDNRMPESQPIRGTRKRILLTHYPTDADKVTGEPYDLILAGHSHGGQCRIPFVGALVVPERVGLYDRGLFDTEGGPLYVNPGIGAWLFPVRFCCRPEITVFEI